MDIRQSQQYANYVKSLGWQVEKIDKWNAFIKKFPFLGSLIKIQRVESPIAFAEIDKLAQKHHAFQVILEPASFPQTPACRQAGPHIPQEYKPLRSPFVPTKTLVINLAGTIEQIFNSFSKNKRRDIRLCEKSKIIIKEDRPEVFLKIKQQTLLQKWILPIGTDREILPLYNSFAPDAKVLIAYYKEKPVAGTLLLFHQNTAYYWQAAATKEGKKLLAPTFLLWEAIKLAKKKGCTKFDLEGIYDYRFPQNKSWLGFTHFKQGFGGKEVLYPAPIKKDCFPFCFRG